MGLFGFGDDTYSKSYLMYLGKKYGIDAEAGHLIEKGIRVFFVCNGRYNTDSRTDFKKMKYAVYIIKLSWILLIIMMN